MQYDSISLMTFDSNEMVCSMQVTYSVARRQSSLLQVAETVRRYGIGYVWCKYLPTLRVRDDCYVDAWSRRRFGSTTWGYRYHHSISTPEVALL